MDLGETEGGGVDWIGLVQSKTWIYLMSVVMIIFRLQKMLGNYHVATQLVAS
jgi:hypothetical protein